MTGENNDFKTFLFQKNHQLQNFIASSYDIRSIFTSAIKPLTLNFYYDFLKFVSKLLNKNYH